MLPKVDEDRDIGILVVLVKVAREALERRDGRAQRMADRQHALHTATSPREVMLDSPNVNREGERARKSAVGEKFGRDRFWHAGTNGRGRAAWRSSRRSSRSDHGCVRVDEKNRLQGLLNLTSRLDHCRAPFNKTRKYR